MSSPDPRRFADTATVPRVRCAGCEHLLKKVNQARMHALLTLAWSELRAKQPIPKAQAKSAASRLEEAFAELENHWRDNHQV